MFLFAVFLLVLHLVTGLASRNLGMYILLADDTDAKGYDSNKDWQPQLYTYQQNGSDILFFTFINPDDMPDVPPAYANLAKTRGSNGVGAVPADTTILFAIGGQAYSVKPNPWKFLESEEAALEMAESVSKWDTLYGCDGIDLDIETGAGSQSGASKYLPIFVAKIKELNPNFIVTQPVFGSPSSVASANRVLEAGFNKTIGDTISPYSYGSIARVGIMVYYGDGAKDYVDNYANGCTKHCTQWWCPLAACVPTDQIFLGAGGGSGTDTMQLLQQDVITGNLGGIMVWYASVLDKATSDPAVVYGASMDASSAMNAGHQYGWANVLKSFHESLNLEVHIDSRIKNYTL